MRVDQIALPFHHEVSFPNDPSAGGRSERLPAPFCESAMSLHPLIIQGAGLAGTVLFFVSFQCRSNRNLFRVQLLSYLFYTVHLMLLGATAGAVSYVINACRSLCLGSRWRFARRWEMCALLCLAQAASLFFTWNGWMSLLPVVANIAATLAGYTRNARKIRVAGMFINSPLWIAYDVLVGSWAGILDEVVSEISMIVSIVRFGWKELDREEA